MDRHAALEQPAAQAEREPRRLHRGVVGHEQAAAEARRVAARADGGGVERDHARPGAPTPRPPRGPVHHGVLRLGRRRHHEAGRAEPRVDALGLAPGADRPHAVGRRLARRQRALVAEAVAQRRKVRPQRLAEPAVAPARPVPADLGLEHHDTRVGRRSSSCHASTCRCSRRRARRRRRPGHRPPAPPPRRRRPPGASSRGRRAALAIRWRRSARTRRRARPRSSRRARRARRGRRPAAGRGAARRRHGRPAGRSAPPRAAGR